MCRNNLVSAAQQYQMPVVPVMPSLDSVIDVLGSVDVEQNGQIVKQAKYVTDNSRTRYDGLKASDFELANQLAAGVDLKPVKLSMNSFEAVGYAVHQIEKLSSFNSQVNNSKS